MKVFIVNVRILDKLVSVIDGLILIRVLFIRFFREILIGCRFVVCINMYMLLISI